MAKLQEVFRKNVLLHLGERSKNWLAKDCGVQSGSLTTALSEGGNPTIKTIEAISKSLEVAPAVLLGGTDGESRKIPNDILESLEGQSPAVYAAVRTILKTIASEKTKPSKAHSSSDRK